MNLETLARAYLTKASNRRRVLEVLLEQDAFSDVIREAQELVELALKAALRLVGIDPPKWHDVGPLLVEHEGFFPQGFRPRIARLAQISRWLRKEREFAFYGDVDFIPTEEYSRADAERAISDALFVLEVVQELVSGD